MSYECISIEQAQELIEHSEVTLIDIRDADSFSQSNIPNAINISSANIEQFLSGADKSKPLIVYCYHGNSSKGAAEYFFNMGFGKSYSMDEGFEGWKQKSVPSE